MFTSLNFLWTVLYIKINFIVFSGNNQGEMYEYKFKFTQWRNPKEEDDDDEDETGKVVFNSSCCIVVFVVLILEMKF